MTDKTRVDVSELRARLAKDAENSSQIHRQMAEAKSLRQGDCDPPRPDLYWWPKPEETLSGRASAALEAQAAQIEALTGILRDVREIADHADGLDSLARDIRMTIDSRAALKEPSL